MRNLPNIEQEEHCYSAGGILGCLVRMLTRTLVHSAGLRKSVDQKEQRQECIHTIKLTVAKTAAPPIKQTRRPKRSTIWALMIVPAIPTVLSPPARPFCLIVL